MFITIIQCFLINIVLNILQQLLYVFFYSIARTGFFFQCITTHHFHGIVLKITATHYQTNRHTFQFVICKLESRTFVVRIVIFHRNAHCFQLIDNAFHLCINLLQHFIILIDRNDNYLDRSQMRRQYQSVIIRVSHNQRTHQAGRYPPRSGPNIIQFIVLVDKLHIERLCEILSQEVRSTTLQCLSILHQAFDGVSIQCTRETFISRFYPFDYRDSHILFSEVTIHMQHFLCFRFCFLAGRMSRMTFLPQELRSTQEQTGTHLPPHNICPLVTQDRQVTIGINPIFIGTPNDGFGGRTDDQFFFQSGSRIYDHT